MTWESPVVHPENLVLLPPSLVEFFPPLAYNWNPLSMLFHLRAILLLWLFAWPVAGQAQWQRATVGADDYLVDVWTSENGLPDSSVTAIAQTPDGYLWVGTYNGLARFDGVRFVTFDPANTPALSHARVRKLFLDARGRLWINGYDGSLVIYDHGTFTAETRNIRFSEGELVLVSSTTNQTVFLTGRGDLFCKTMTAPPGEGWEVLPPPARGLNAQCCQDGNGLIWYRDGDKNLWWLQAGQFVPLPAAAGLASQGVNHLTVDAQGKIWVGTDQGVAYWNGHHFVSLPAAGENPAVNFLTVAPDGRVWVVAGGWAGYWETNHWQFQTAEKHPIFSANSGRLGAQPDHRNGMWFYNYGRGLVHLSAAAQVRPLTAEDNFPGDRVYGFFEDHEGNWWAGLDAGGLVRLRERQFHVVAAAEKNLLRAAKSVGEAVDGTVWLGMLSGGLGAWRDGVLTNLSVIESSGGGSVFCVCPDNQGRLWLSAGDEDLYVREQGEIRRVQPVIHGVKAILVDHAGRIWLGTTGGLLVSATGEDFQPCKGSSWRYVRALAEDRSGTIWAGTGNGELLRVTTNTVTAFHPNDNRESGAIWSVLADAEGTVWVGTFRGGLLRFRDGEFTRFRKSDGLPSNVICQLLDDEQGNLWIGSHQGIFRVAKAALEAFAQGKTQFIPSVDYGRSDGLPSLECSGGYQPAAERDREGRLWFTTVKGAAWIQPAETRLNQKSPPVAIEEVVVDGRPVPLAPPAGITIPPGRHQIEFRYTGLSLAAPERVQFRYQLTGIDNGWLLAGTRRVAQYNVLPPGDYNFRVIACNSDGVWNESGAELRVFIQPHFYETWWSRTLALLVLLGAVAMLVRRLAVRRLRQQMEELERKRMVERERARIAKDIHDDLGASLTLIAVLGDLAKKEKSEERIAKMSSTAREAVKSLDEIVWAVNPRNDTLAHLIDYTGQFAVDYLRDAGIRCLLDVPDHTPDRAVLANVRHNLFLVVKEALQNIVKHARATEVWLRVQAGETALRIVVEDNGCGFTAAPAEPEADGLENMRQRLAEVGGTCRVESQLGQGTSLTFELQWPAN
jgi:signal transduction histidine kinase/ligand-binding sensor domain-containing protein